MSTHEVDWPKIRDAVAIACEIRDMSLRDVASAIGISPSSLTRLRQGYHLEADALASLIAWLFPKSFPIWIKEATP